MSAKKWLPTYIGRRYAAVNTSTVPTSFISRLSVIGLSLGVAILIAVLSMMNGFDRELREKILALLPHITVNTIQNYALDDEEEWQSVIDKLREQPWVTGLAPKVEVQGMVIANGESKGVGVSGIRAAQEQGVSIIDRFMVEGSMDGLQPGTYGVLIGQDLAETLGVGIGDTVNLVSTEVPVTLLGGFPRRKNFTVRGIFSIGSQLDASLVYAQIEDIQKLYRLGNGIHGIRIQVDDLFSVITYGETIRSDLPENASVSYWTYDYGNIYENIKLSKSIVGLLLFLLVVVAVFNIIVSLSMIIRDKKGDIAILRTMGASNSTIRSIFMVQGFLIGLFGTLMGLVFGLLLTFSLPSITSWAEEKFSFELFSADVYPVNYLPTQLIPSEVIGVCLLALLLCVLATLYPAYSAARIQPAEALRFE